jgi:hypothetical protein
LIRATDEAMLGTFSAGGIMRTLKHLFVTGFVVWVGVVGLSPTGCLSAEDEACDVASQECIDQGGTPGTCEANGSCVLATCECQCTF